MIELGWREWVALPDLGIPRLRAKIDTGARTSALHVDRQWRFTEAGAPWVGFTLTTGKAGSRTIQAQAAIFDERAVTDSGGRRGVRVFIQTLLAVAGTQRLIEINLSDRFGMRFPMLLGRTGLEGMFTVDPSCSFVHGRPAPRLGQLS
jgi:hypothetical protein